MPFHHNHNNKALSQVLSVHVLVVRFVGRVATFMTCPGTNMTNTQVASKSASYAMVEALRNMMDSGCIERAYSSLLVESQ